MAGPHMSHVLFVIDQLRQEDDAIALTAIAQGLMDAGIDQTHLLASPSDGQQISPILEGVDCISTRMPRRWWGRARTAQDCAAHFARRPVDLVFWSGDQAASLSRELAAELESPLIGDVWKRSQVDAAKRSPLVDAWIARTDSLSAQLRDELNAGTVITARPPVSVQRSSRLPGRRPAIVMLDPGQSTRHAAPLLDALRSTLDARPDIEAFLELRGGASHTLWKMVKERGLLEHVSVLDRVGTMGRLVAEATIVVAADPDGPARTVIPLAMAGGAAIIAASNACEELLEDDVTARLVDTCEAERWHNAMISLITEPPLRQQLAHEGQRRAQAATRHDTALDAWLTAFTTTMEPATYPIGTTAPARHNASSST